MKAKKQKINTDTHLEKILTFAGLTLIIVGCIANLYSAYINQRFIHDPIDLLYYFRYIILLGGGFAVGCLLTKKSAGYTRHRQLFLGVIYATLAVALYMLFDAARTPLQGIFGYAPYPWGKMIFMGMPLLAITATAAVAYLSQYRPNRHDSSTIAKIGIVLSFIIYEVYRLASGAYYLIVDAAKYDPNTPIWLMVGSYLLTPIVIALTAYLLLSRMKKQLNRFFYAALIGMFYATLTLALWEFRADASHEATNIFAAITTALTLLFVGIILWRARKAIK